MEILGLDKIRKISDNTDLEIQVTGLEHIRSEIDMISVTGLDSIHRIEENDFPKMSPFALELIRLVSRAKELDTEYRQLGAGCHRYEFAPVVPMSRVRDFEKRHHLRLPQGYVDFLTQVGNGGAGPYYGIYSLEQAELEGYFDHKDASCQYMQAREQPDYYHLPYSIQGTEPMVNRNLSINRWENWYTELNRKDRQAYSELYPQAYNGLLQIIQSENDTGYMLICHGESAGEMVYFRKNLECPEPTGVQFEDFVLSYFKSVISKLERGKC